MRVLMIPSLSMFDNYESGIKRVVENYYRLGKDYGIEFVECNIDDNNAYDIYAIHAGSSSRFPTTKPIVSHLHGLYWTQDYKAGRWEWVANSNVIESARRSTVITVPSDWVAETIQRDMRINPVVVPHGINVDDWKHNRQPNGSVLWNKNRSADVCNPIAVGNLAQRFPSAKFITTFAPFGSNNSTNIHIIGLQSAADMKNYIQSAEVYLSTTKETFGIGILEALASGVPVLGFDYGGNRIFVKHCVNGYLATPGDYDDLSTGLEYCVKYRNVLSQNAVVEAKKWTWDNAMKSLKYSYELALGRWESGKRLKYIPKELYERQ